MRRGTTERPNLIQATIAAVIGTTAFAAAVSGWLSTPELANQLCPPDIVSLVVQCLGGSVGRDAVGAVQWSLSTAQVFLRLAACLITFSAVTCWVGRNRHPERSALSTSLRLTALLFTASSAWWLLWAIGSLQALPVQNFCVAVLSLWVTTTAGIFVWIWSLPWMNMPSSAVGPVKANTVGPFAVLLTAVFVWVLTSFWMNYCLYEQLMIPHGDSAMYEEHLWNVWHGKGFRSYLDQGLFLGEHVQVIHLLLLPLHLLWPSHLCLELAESVALGSCALPIFLIARRHLNNSWAATILGMAWLFYYPMHFLDIAIDQKTFRPIALGLPFVFWLIEFVERRSVPGAVVCLLIALSAKEDVALVLGPLLFVMGCRARASETVSPDTGSRMSSQRASRLLFAGAVFCGLYLVAVVLVVIPAFRAGDHVHYSRYFGDLGGTPGELIRTAMTDPLKVISAAFDHQTLLYVCVFLAPLGFVPLRKPFILAAGVLTFGMLSLLDFGDGGFPPVPYHHFHAPLLPVVFWACVIAVSGIHSLRLPLSGRLELSATACAWLVLCCSAATSLTNSLMPNGVTFWSSTSPFGYAQSILSKDPRQKKRAEYADDIAKLIPCDARVAATDYIHTRLTHCDRSYDYSDYLRAVNDYQPGVPQDTQYIVIDTGHRYSEIPTAADTREIRETPEDWDVLPDETEGLFIVLKRRAR